MNVAELNGPVLFPDLFAEVHHGASCARWANKLYGPRCTATNRQQGVGAR